MKELLVIHLDCQRLTSALRLDSHVAIQVSLSCCMLGVSQTVSFGGFGMVDMLPESPFMAVLRGLWAGGAVPLAGGAVPLAGATLFV